MDVWADKGPGVGSVPLMVQVRLSIKHVDTLEPSGPLSGQHWGR